MLIGRLRQGVTMSTLRVHIKQRTKLLVIGQANCNKHPFVYRPTKRQQEQMTE